MRKILLIPSVAFFSLILVAVSALAANWQHLSTEDSGTSFYFDQSNVKYADGMVKLYQKETYSEAPLLRIRERLGAEYRDFTDLVKLLEISCSDERWRVLSVSYNDSKGGVISSLNRERGGWESIPRRSLVNLLYELCCPREWVYVVSSKASDYFLDLGTMMLSKSRVTFWMKTVNKETKKETERTKFTFRCRDKDYAIGYYVRYRPDGSVSNVRPYLSYLEWSGIDRHTIMDEFRGLLCTDSGTRNNIDELLEKIPQPGAKVEPAPGK